MAVCWILFPLVLAILSLGCGLLLEQVTGRRMPGPLLIPAGFATIVVAAQLAVSTDTTAELATPLVVALAVAGLALAFPWSGMRPDGWALVAAIGVFCAYGAPIVLSGEATFAGYIKLDDTATWFTLTDRVMEHGRSLEGLAPSSYEATLAFNLGDGYPIGVFLPFGIGAELVGQDLAWVFQPYVAFMAAMLALTLYALTAPLVRSAALRALAAFVAAQAALLFGYSLWGGVKEVAAAALVALVAALVPDTARVTGSHRCAVAAAVAIAALIAVLSAGGLLWLVPLLAGAVVLAVRELGARAAAWRAAALAGLTTVLSVPMLASGLLPPTSSPLTSDDAKGNLIEPLSPLQFFGVWPVGDFRLRPDDMDLTRLLIALVALAGVLGLYWAVRRRAWEMAGFVATASLGCLLLAVIGSPWVDGKVLATASPAFLIAALAAGAIAFESGRRVEAALAVAAIAAGVLWSNTLAYQDVNLAPRDRLAELEQVGERIAGEGPALMTDYEPYGVRHFLREADAEGASELRRRVVPLRSGGSLGKLEYADLDEFQLDAILTYPTLVVRRSPAGSRPPAPYRRTFDGRWYEVWQRPVDGGPRVAEHLSLGAGIDPTAEPDCDDVERLARAAGPRGRIVAAVRPDPVIARFARATRPPDWRRTSSGYGVIVPESAGTLGTSARLPRRGRYEAWLGGSFRRQVAIAAEGAEVLESRDQLNHAEQWVPFGLVRLDRGRKAVALTYPEQDWRPGSGAPPFGFGPIALTRAGADARLERVDPEDARDLCGRELDWIEAIRT